MAEDNNAAVEEQASPTQTNGALSIFQVIKVSALLRELPIRFIQIWHAATSNQRFQTNAGAGLHDWTIPISIHAEQLDSGISKRSGFNSINV